MSDFENITISIGNKALKKESIKLISEYIREQCKSVRCLVLSNITNEEGVKNYIEILNNLSPLIDNKSVQFKYAENEDFIQNYGKLNADEIAANAAIQNNSSQLVFITDIDGIYDPQFFDHDEVCFNMPLITASEAKKISAKTTSKNIREKLNAAILFTKQTDKPVLITNPENLVAAQNNTGGTKVIKKHISESPLFD